uniref:Uncharacterized protein n=1 Tax=Oryza barthii TaxID=65489 RepID=A0A0D3HCJ9_9ORYZ
MFLLAVSTPLQVSVTSHPLCCQGPKALPPNRSHSPAPPPQPEPANGLSFFPLLFLESTASGLPVDGCASRWYPLSPSREPFHLQRQR